MTLIVLSIFHTFCQVDKIKFLFAVLVCCAVITRWNKLWQIYKPGNQHAPGFLKLFLFTDWYVCSCVYTLRALLTNGIVWCDIDLL